MDSLKYTELGGYDAVELSLNCLSGVNRKMVMTAGKLQDILLDSEIVAFQGSDVPKDSYIFDAKSSMGLVTVNPATLRPRPWLSGDGRKVGGVFCELVSPNGEPGNELSPRSVAVKQVARLKKMFGLTIKSAVETEFMIFQKDGITPFNNKTHAAFGRVDNMAGMEECLLEACHSLEEAGLPVETLLSELATGQFEITFRPQEGVASADTIVTMKEGLRASLGKHSLAPTFMACPNDHGHANGFHFNHSLWDSNGINQFVDLDDHIYVSATARHWIAGLVRHAPALTALLCPTLNCYIRLADDMTPTTATWGEENRFTFLRLKTERLNVYLENRLPSSACNSYLTLAGVIAAGIDGLDRKLECPPQNDPTAPQIPKSLEEAVACLEHDTVLAEALGEGFIRGFVDLAKKTLNDKATMKLDELGRQRDIYFHCI
jgi:glutamine synthetase